jgi:CheY-like chemotaxis protein
MPSRNERPELPFLALKTIETAPGLHKRRAFSLASISSRRPVVLVVEDEPLIHLVALDIVTHEGFEAIGAANADEAIRILETRNDISIVFTDVHMPGSMDGVKLAHAVRGRWPPIKIIVTSALGNHALPAHSVFLSKPCDSAQISAALQDLAA